MKTEIITENIPRAAEIIRAGGLVAVPTETVYGLAGNGLDTSAVQRIYDVKGRPEVKPLSLMVPDAGAFDAVCRDAPPAARALAEKFWPGPLTIVLPAKDTVPAIVRAGGDTVGLRCPDHALTLALLKSAGVPLAAPSANPSGAPSPKTAGEVLAYFDGRIDAVIDGGPCGIGTESTIIDLAHTPYSILRRGALSEETVFAALRGSVTLIGITGGSGSGKTTALDTLRSMGALVLDCDAIYHDLTVSCADMQRELTARFGDVYDGDTLDRKRLGAMVFGNAAALADLNAITHKYVCRELDRLLTDHARRGGTLAAIDAIGLLDIEHSSRTRCNVAITAPVEQRIARLMAREGIDEAYAHRRIAAQHSDEYFAKNCHFTLCNDGTKAEFEDKCTKFFTEVLQNG